MLLHFFNLTFFTPIIVFMIGTGFENGSLIYNEANVDIFLRNCSFLTLFVSMIFYWIQTAFSSPISLASNLKSQKKTNISAKKNSFSSDLVLNFPSNEKTASNIVKQLERESKDSALIPLNISNNSNSLVKLKLEEAPFNLNLKKKHFLISFWTENLKKTVNFGTITMIISNLLLIFLLIFRWRESGHFPLSNLYESLMFLSWSCTLIHLVLEFKTEKIRPDATLLTNVIGSITSPIALFTNAFATFSLPAEMQKASPLVPALQSNWLMMHVTVMIISYSALILGSLLSIAFLILISSFSLKNFASFFSKMSTLFCYARRGKNLEAKAKSENNKLISNTQIDLRFSLPQKANTPYKIEETDSPFGGTGVPSKAKMTLAWNFDNLSYRVLGIGFPFLTIGILSGAVWANEAWGSYWSWDPKETWALLTWLIFAIYLHARITKGWQGKKPAIIASFGFLAIWICFLGVNLIGEGLHSYGWFSQ